MVLGLGRSVVSHAQGRFRRRAFLLIVVGLLFVSIPLSLTAYQNVLSARENAKATAEVQQWLAGTSYRVDTVNTNDGVVEVSVEGTGPLRPARASGKPTRRRARTPVCRGIARASSPEGHVKRSIKTPVGARQSVRAMYQRPLRGTPWAINVQGRCNGSASGQPFASCIE